MVDEQGVDAPAEGDLAADVLARTASDGRDLSTLLDQAETALELDRMVLTQIADAGRAGQALAMVSRPALSGFVRYLNPPSCARCTILAGRFYRWSSSFLRHPLCDCVMVPSTEGAADGLIGNPDEAFRAGQVRGLSRAETQAIYDGADISQVVNAHRAMESTAVWGHTVKVTTEGTTVRGVAGRGLAAEGVRLQRKKGSRYSNVVIPRLTPQAIYRVAKDREDAIRLLKRFGYIT
jgi:hypothetical protein